MKVEMSRHIEYVPFEFAGIEETQYLEAPSRKKGGNIRSIEIEFSLNDPMQKTKEYKVFYEALAKLCEKSKRK